MKKHLPTIVAILFGIVAVVFLMRSCRTDAEYKSMKSDYNLYKRVVEANNEIQQANILQAEKTIAIQDNTIRGLRATSAANVTAIGSKDKKLAELEAELAGETDKDKIIFNLKSQIVIWSDKYSLAVGIIEAQKEEIAAWEVKFNEQGKISQAWKVSYENEHRLRGMAEGLVTALESRVRSFRFKSRALTLATSVAVGYIAYSVVKDAIGK